MKKLFYRVRPHIMIINEEGNKDGKTFKAYDVLNNQSHRGDAIQKKLLNYLVLPRMYDDIVSFCSSTSSLSHLSDQDIQDTLNHYQDKKVVEKAEHEFEDIYNRALVSHRKSVKMVGKDTKPESFPHIVYLHPTMRCDLRCKHCSAKYSGLPSIESELSLGEIFHIFDILEKNGVWLLQISGGEALMRPDIFEILEETTKRRFKVTFFSNCYSLDKSKVRRLQKIQEKKQKGFLLHFSIDGATPETHNWLRGKDDAFQKLIESLKMLNEAGIRLVTESIIHRKSIDQIREICAICAKYGVQSVFFHTASYAGMAAKNYIPDLVVSPDELIRISDIIYECQLQWEDQMWVDMAMVTSPPTLYMSEKVKRRRYLLGESNLTPDSGDFRCSAGTTQISIDADGTIYPCPNSHGVAKFALGNVRTTDLVDLWVNDKRLLFFRGGWEYSDLAVCKNCQFSQECRVAQNCRIESMHTWGDPYGPNPVCSIYKNLYKTSLPEMGKYKVV